MKNKLIQKLVSISLPLSVLLTLSIILPLKAAIVIAILGTTTIAPILDKQFTKYLSHQDKMKIKEEHYIQQLRIGLAEMDKKGTRINKMTPFFTNMILKKANEHSINIDEDSLQNINQFLYMINSNYYEIILDTFKVNNQRLLTREELLRKIIDVIFDHMDTIEKYTFDDTNINDILKNCPFIKAPIKEEMELEFKNAKVPDVLGTSRYIIERKDVKIENIARDYNKNYMEANEKDVSFDIYEKESYIIAIKKIMQMPHYRQKSEIKKIAWDVDSLMEIITKLVQKYNSELEQSIEDYSIAKFTAKLMLASVSYSLVNKRRIISYKEITSAFKILPNIPEKLFNEISKYLDTLCAKKSLEKPNQKVLIFNPSYVENK